MDIEERKEIMRQHALMNRLANGWYDPYSHQGAIVALLCGTRKENVNGNIVEISYNANRFKDIQVQLEITAFHADIKKYDYVGNLDIFYLCDFPDEEDLPSKVKGLDLCSLFKNNKRDPGLAKIISFEHDFYSSLYSI